MCKSAYVVVKVCTSAFARVPVHAYVYVFPIPTGLCASIYRLLPSGTESAVSVEQVRPFLTLPEEGDFSCSTWNTRSLKCPEMMCTDHIVLVQACVPLLL